MKVAVKLAGLVRRAAHLHENSYDSGMGTFAVSISEAADEACNEVGEPDLGWLIAAALNHDWNDALVWAGWVRTTIGQHPDTTAAL